MVESVQKFVQVADEYCSVVENHDRYLRDEFLYRVHQVLPLLYYRALQLPDVEGRSDSESLGRISHDQWQEMFQRLGEYLKEYDAHWVVHDLNVVDESPPEVMLSSLADDLVDVWRNLKDGLIHWTGADEDLQASLVWEWRFSFISHWSDHVLDALRPIKHWSAINHD